MGGGRSWRWSTWVGVGLLTWGLVACDDASKDAPGGDAEVTPPVDVPEAEVVEVADLVEETGELPPDAADLSETTELSEVADAADADAAEAVDVPPDPPCAAGGHFVEAIYGQVVDGAGQPVAGARAQPCLRREDGTLLCLRPEPTGADGAVAITYEGFCITELTLRVLLPNSSMSTAYCTVPLPSSGRQVQLAAPVVLHATEAPLSLPPLGDGAQARQVDFAGGFSLSLVPDQLDSDVAAYEDLAARRLDVAAAQLCTLPAGAPLAAIAFYPEADLLAPAQVTLRLNNPWGLAPAEQVSLHVLGGLHCTDAAGEVLHEGRWVPLGPATVAADGAAILYEGHLPCLTWLAITE